MTIRTTTKSALIKLAILFMCASAFVHAQTESEPLQTHERVYQVELIIFSRAEVNPKEVWPKDVHLSYPENLVALKSDANTDGFSLLPASERTLNSQAATISRNGSYSLLYHQAWRQTIFARKTHIFISGVKSTNGHQELEGSISLSVGQYLKIQTNLWLSQFALPGTELTEQWPSLPPLPFTESVLGEQNANNLIKRIVKISEDRSMRSNEVHYIDHPLLGVIVKIIPYDAPNKTN